MSFARRLKDELARLVEEEASARRALLAGIVRGGWRGGEVLLEHAGTARTGFWLARRLGLSPHLTARIGQRHGVHYWLRLEAPETRLRRLLGLPGTVRPFVYRRMPASALRAYVRGLFLAAGSCTDPAKGYHLEFVLLEELVERELLAVLARRHLPVGSYLRRNHHVVYLKDGDGIAQLLGWMGAREALFQFENTRAWRGMRDEVNRMVNAETANVAKTVEASLRQVAAVERLRAEGRLAGLPERLRRTAELRLQYPEATLEELAEQLGCSKSGVNHRLRRLVRLAEGRGV